MQTKLPISLPENLGEEASAMGDWLSEGGADLKETASEMSQTAAEKIDGKLGSAANGLDKAAGTLREKARRLPGAQKAGRLVHATADKLSATAGYFREHDVRTMTKDAKMLVRRNPAPSLILAGFAGFLVGRAFARSK